MGLFFMVLAVVVVVLGIGGTAMYFLNKDVNKADV
jgi:hypothetical protein